MLKGNELQNADYISMSTAWAAGGIYSTVQDLTLWNEALAHGKLLNSDSTKRMCSVYPETLYQGMHCGYAVVLAERFGHQLQYHGGGISGFQTVLQRYPEEGLVIAVMANVESDETLLGLGDGLAQISFSAERH